MVYLLQCFSIASPEKIFTSPKSRTVGDVHQPDKGSWRLEMGGQLEQASGPNMAAAASSTQQKQGDIPCIWRYTTESDRSSDSSEPSRWKAGGGPTDHDLTYISRKS